ncbi:MAG: heat shock protein HslVU, ATPase subunit HslU [Candidatus Xenolissoclinum pacificiensis L6]|uniref:Heat shock protein HslVU, ATPase subunit HslU n=1 Tax=Candidatus Xenolissoclinum pacificiensis L6 TaxID=1401685 RepID=W2V1P7_9RICK|nr:MAG: heat shock protein HslVU, ATPase subunit HslU [Candidatus Xenolissoclinum pacificiensis L6]
MCDRNSIFLHGLSYGHQYMGFSCDDVVVDSYSSFLISDDTVSGDERSDGDGVLPVVVSDFVLKSDSDGESYEDKTCKAMDDLYPPKIVEILDRYIIGQKEAKRKVAIAMRSRWRRSKVEKDFRKEIRPTNILMIGPTGVGKTEIARRLASYTMAPFIKVEATKFTEIGYVGRDVDSMIRDLVDIAIMQIKDQERERLFVQAQEIAKGKILNIIAGSEDSSSVHTRELFKKKLDSGILDDQVIEIAIKDRVGSQNSASFDIPGMSGQIGVMNLGDMFNKFMNKEKTKVKRLKISEALKILTDDGIEDMFDEDMIIKHAMELVSNYGIVFLDEVDKIASNRQNMRGEVNREGVQRDLLPLLEGTTVNTKYGPVKTDFILFVACGAFIECTPADLLPEFQGRLPVRVKLEPIDLESMVLILKSTESSLLKQYQSMLATEGVKIEFTDCAIHKIAEIAIHINRNVENIGARRLHTVMEKVMEDISFSAPSESDKYVIDEKYVAKQLHDFESQTDLIRFIL